MVLLAFLVTLTSCEHKDLCYEHYATLRINFDWTYAPDADPQSMRVYFYRDDSSTFYRVADFDRTGGYLRDVSPGTYHIICFNNTETAYERDGATFVRQALTTSTTSVLEPINMASTVDIPVASGTEDQEVRRATETIWGCTQLDIVVTQHDTTYHEVFDDSVDYSTMGTVSENEITLYPRELSCLYTVEIRNVENLSSVDVCGGTISGLAQYLNLSTDEPDGNSVIVPFAFEATDATTLVGQFTNFGTTEQDANQLVIYVWTLDGKGYAYGINDIERLNVTSQVRSASDPHRVHIIIDGFTMPVSESSGSGTAFDADVDDWESENQDIAV